MQVISHVRSAITDTSTFLQGSEVGVISSMEVPDLLDEIYDIQDEPVSKKVGNLDHILTILFSFSSVQHREGWALQFTFLNTFQD